VSLLRAAAVVLSACCLAACSSKATLEIQATNAWSGTITEGNNAPRAIEGTGNASLKVDLSGDVCWFVSKKTKDGRLRVFLQTKGFMGPSDRFGDKDTFDDFGIVQACGS
jgi:hypothetical protein